MFSHESKTEATIPDHAYISNYSNLAEAYRKKLVTLEELNILTKEEKQDLQNAARDTAMQERVRYAVAAKIVAARKILHAQHPFHGIPTIEAKHRQIVENGLLKPEELPPKDKQVFSSLGETLAIQIIANHQDYYIILEKHCTEKALNNKKIKTP